MSNFYAEIKGNRGPTSRGGSKQSGIWGHIRGWNLGIKVYGYVDENGKDCFTVYKTGGSKNPSGEIIAEIKE